MKSQKFHLSFVEEGIMDEKYKDWTGGRVEVFVNDETFNIEEFRFLTLRNKDWEEFREKYDGEDVDIKTLDIVKSVINKR
jgi:hypothetical protein